MDPLSRDIGGGVFGKAQKAVIPRAPRIGIPTLVHSTLPLKFILKICNLFTYWELTNLV